MTELSMEVSRVIPHAPEKVFDAWLDPGMLVKFMTPGPGMTVPEANVDAREGGRFKIVMNAPDMGDLIHEGEYLKIDRPNQLVFTWQSPYSIDGSTVTLNFSAEGSGTAVHLRHVKFPNEESRDNHLGGWTGILTALETAL